MKWDIIVIGAGAAGMMAAYVAAGRGGRVLLLERNKAVGRKLLITGAGRCNLTNEADLNELVANIPGNGRFLYSALQQFGPADLIRLVSTELGVPLKVERGRRVFPVSDQAREIVAAFEKALRGQGVEIITGCRVQRLLIAGEQVTGVATEDGRTFLARKVIVATGGAAYPGTGSSGDGYRLAAQAGHELREIFPSLVPLETEEAWPKQVEGLTLMNTAVAAYQGNVRIGVEFGDLLFTGFGVSGPIILSLSRKIVQLVVKDPGSVRLTIDLKPALSEEELDRRIQRDFNRFIRKMYKNALDALLPKSMIPVIIDLSGIDPELPVHQITKGQRQTLLMLLKGLTLTVTKPRSWHEAIVTAGGVSVKELQPKTMASKRVDGLYFVGEVADVDGYTGGYNLQIAFSMGYAAAVDAVGMKEWDVEHA